MSDVSAVKTTKGSSNYRFFIWVVLFLSLAQLLIGLDYIGIWSGAEHDQIVASIKGIALNPIQLGLLELFPNGTDLWLFYYRLPGLFMYVGSLGLFYLWANPLFGKRAVELTLLVLACSLFLPIMAKISSGDIYQFSFLLLFWVTFLRAQKGGEIKWIVLATLFGILSMLVHASWILLLIWGIGFAWLFKKEWSNNWQKAAPLLISMVAGIAFLFLSPFELAYFTKGGIASFKGILYALLGLAPVLGFVFAGLRDVTYKWKRKEEFSQILVISLIGALLTSPLLLGFLLALLAAKQMYHYFDSPNYPWHDWVKGIAVLHLVSVFILVVLTLIGGYINFQGDGFRAGLGATAAYWMFSLIGVIGLYGYKRDYVWGGMCLSGVVALLFFWMQVYPFVHLQRNWPERITKVIVTEKESVVALDESALSALPYLLRKGIEVDSYEESEINKAAVFILPMQDSLVIEQKNWGRNNYDYGLVAVIR